MKKFSMIGLFSLLSLAAVNIASARTLTFTDAVLDSSQNIYTGSIEPSDASIRVSEVSSSGTETWKKDIAAPTGYTFNSNLAVKLDSSNDLYVACSLTNTSTSDQEIGIYELSSTGTLTNSYVFAPASGTTTALVVGLAVDTSKNAYVAYQYDTTTGTEPFSSLLLCNNGITSHSTTSISYSGASYTTVSDIVADTSGSVYIGATAGFSSGAYGYLMQKYTAASFPTAGWTVDNTFASGYYLDNLYGVLTLDSSSRLTYMNATYSTSPTTAYGLYGVQVNITTHAVNWSSNISSSLTNFQGASAATVDSSGNIYVVSDMLEGTPGGDFNYYLAKVSSSGTYQWSTNYDPSPDNLIAQNPASIALDAGGSVLVAETGTTSSGHEAEIQEFSSTGSLSHNYTYVGTAGSDYATTVLPTSTAGTWYVAGAGKSGTTYYPLNYKMVSGSVSWHFYVV